MKKLLVAGIAAVAFCGGPAFAADVPVIAPAQLFNWGGLYIGAHGGYGWGRDRSFYESGPVTSSLDPKGVFGGGQIGYNYYLAPKWVLGYEVDLSASGIRDSGLSSDPTVAASSKIDYFGTARARLGYAVDHWLIYGTGGTAWAHNRFLENVIATGQIIISRDQFYFGWTLGAGFEYALNRNWSIKAEYLYADLGKNKDVFTLGGGSVSRSTELTTNLVRVGVNYRFDGSAPAAAASPAYPVKASPMRIASLWSGSYVGIHGGYAGDKSHIFDGTISEANNNVSNLNPSGGFGGFQAGYDWRIAPNWVFGLISETSFGGLTDSGLMSPSTDPVKIKVDRFGSERARLGVLATDNVLIYGTGGLAWAHFKFNNATTGELASFDPYRVGWTAGGGFEYAFAPLWSAKLEYLYADLGTYRDAGDSNGLFHFPRSASLTENTIKVGIDYHGSILGALFGR